MKYQYDQTISRSSRRTIMAFSNALAELLTKESFENITVNSICQEADYPRSTFYNYFEDKYDLLDYCWAWLFGQLHFETMEKSDQQTMLIQAMDRIFDFATEHIDYLNKILKNNSAGYLYNSCKQYFLKISFNIFTELFTNHTNAPVELVVEHCFSAVMIVLEWKFIQHHNISKREANQYLDELTIYQTKNVF
ncbi:TetR/AcrR family transcriptional regulator [Companilactobacillus sp.]|jgi:AcrR family transcriptional regulator|uniref:TetR/AcrR family transcriptional regulator n=1 Tax=Companilactobacillus sp. TaxID=2767905 RepID=UPI0025BAA9C1|nr:TetR/AcrR family transcriptional regulator [Companilactobacillus sp.]MCH4009276.1 TetR/AcrR family transcriptional regulator [Companilactobacillus sp.]MCH4050545.1 TetR/AcrR family transcriptional regulator [Companilactobacillus sp.]MCH4077218.1 TetR/AcrR family transcriptional regulator [Companilactobacillus sp.]MCH4125794.1 TetR/AcrR family transcriptional regulator [Companilactobacillus sp.]MCI1311503.1 TetR/AcrR family transcriptional regulator [Companilactobacillus sp.]